MHNYEETLEALRHAEGVRGATPFVEAVCMAAFDTEGSSLRIPCKFKGLVLESEFQVNSLEEYLRRATVKDQPLPDFTPATVANSPTPGKIYPAVLVGDKFYSEYDPASHEAGD